MSPPVPRLDASMTLLTEVMEHPLDPGYALAARRTATGQAGRRPALVVTAVIAALCGLLATWAVVELRQPQPGGVQARRALEQEIQRRTDNADATQRRNVILRGQIADAQGRALASGGDATLATEGRTLGEVSGELAVTGPGLRITLDDAPGTDATPAAGDRRPDSGTDQGRVQDRDLQIVVNGLWAAGAEAIAINSQRLSSLSAIRSAGQAILVDFRPLLPPYVVEAIGDPAALQAGFAQDMAGPYLKGLRDNFGVQADIVSQVAVSLPGAGAIELHHATSPRRTPSPAPISRQEGSQ